MGTKGIDLNTRVLQRRTLRAVLLTVTHVMVDHLIVCAPFLHSQMIDNEK